MLDERVVAAGTIDCAGVCGGGRTVDCAGVCGGNAVIDYVCGVVRQGIVPASAVETRAETVRVFAAAVTGLRGCVAVRLETAQALRWYWPSTVGVHSGGSTADCLGVCGGNAAPNCDGRQCGDDGCGGSCGECAGGAACNDGQCADIRCRDNENCPAGMGCVGGVCVEGDGCPGDSGTNCGPIMNQNQVSSSRVDLHECVISKKVLRNVPVPDMALCGRLSPIHVVLMASGKMPPV